VAQRLSDASARSSEVLYGRNGVIEALNGRRRHRRLYVATGAERQERIADLLTHASELGLPVMRLHPHELDRVAGLVNHQGVALETSSFPYTALESILADEEKRTLLVLDHVQDPQNLGTLMRSADATGVAGIIIPDRRAASVTPAVVNASAGAVEHLRIARVTNLARALEAAKTAGYWIVGLDHHDDARVLFDESIPQPAGLLVGSEGKGIGPSTVAHCDLVVRVPMFGAIDSLNAAIAASIALYELLRRRLQQVD
jgi:23S rRNA (guanosine2251-2'-O)-methyltransferase